MPIQHFIQRGEGSEGKKRPYRVSVTRTWARAKGAKEAKDFSSEVVLRRSEINQTTSELNRHPYREDARSVKLKLNPGMSG